MGVETGNTYIFEAMRNIIEIPTANLGFTTIESSKKMSASDCNSGRLPEIAICLPKPEILVFGTLTDRIEISTANLGVSTTPSSRKLFPAIAKMIDNPEMAV